MWWRALTGSDETLENAHLMRLAGRFSRRVRGYAKAHNIPVIDCSAGERKHDIADRLSAPRPPSRRACFWSWLVERQAPVWDVSANHHIERKKPIPMSTTIRFIFWTPNGAISPSRSAGIPRSRPR